VGKAHFLARARKRIMVEEDIKEPEAYIIIFWDDTEGDWKVFDKEYQALRYKDYMSGRWNTALVYTKEEARLFLSSVLPSNKSPRFKNIVDKLLNKIGLKRWGT